MAITIDARVKQKTGVASAFAGYTLLEGEMALVRTSATGPVYNFKVGPGNFDDLDWSLQNPGAAQSANTSTVFPSGVPGLYIPTENGTYEGQTVDLSVGYVQLIWDGENMAKVEFPIDVSGKLDTGGYGGNAQDLANAVNGKLAISSLGNVPGANGQLLNPANETEGIGILEDYTTAPTPGAIINFFGANPGQQVTVWWEGGIATNRRCYWVDGLGNPLVVSGDIQGFTIASGRLGTFTVPSGAYGGVIQVKRSDAQEPTRPSSFKVEIGDSPTPGTDFEGGIGKIGESRIYPERALSSDRSDVSSVAESLQDMAEMETAGSTPESVVNWRAILDSVNGPVVDNGQLIDPANDIPGFSIGLDTWHITNPGQFPDAIINRIHLPDGVDEFYYSGITAAGGIARFNRWEDASMNLISGFSISSDGVVTRPPGAVYLVTTVKRPDGTEPVRNMGLKIEAGTEPTPGTVFGNRMTSLFGLSISPENETSPLVYITPNIYLVDGLKLPLFKEGLVRGTDDYINRDIILCSDVEEYNAGNFNRPYFQSILTGTELDPERMGAQCVFWSKDYSKPTEMAGAVCNVVKVDPSSKDGVSFTFAGVGDSIPHNVFNNSVNVVLPQVNGTVTMNRYGTRSMGNPALANDFRQAWSYSAYTGRMNDIGGNTVNPVTSSEQLGELYYNPFLRIATPTDKSNRPTWCYRSTGQRREYSYDEDPTPETGDFWIFDFAHYLDWIGNPTIDVFFIALGSNDLLFYPETGLDDAERGLRIMLESISEVSPGTKIGVVPSPGRGESSDIWTKHCQWMDRINLVLADFPDVDQIPVSPYISRVLSYPKTNNGLLSETGNRTSSFTKGDEVHITRSGGMQYGKAVVSWLMNVI